MREERPGVRRRWSIVCVLLGVGGGGGKVVAWRCGLGTESAGMFRVERRHVISPKRRYVYAEKHNCNRLQPIVTCIKQRLSEVQYQQSTNARACRRRSTTTGKQAVRRCTTACRSVLDKTIQRDNLETRCNSQITGHCEHSNAADHSSTNRVIAQ